MDILKTFSVYVALLYATSINTAPQNIVTPSPTPIKTLEVVATPSPTPTIEPTVAPTFAPTPIANPDIPINKNYKQINFKDKGDEVIKLQTALAKYGYYSGEIDGLYGFQTSNAIRLFQKMHGLEQDGIAGKKTLTILYDYDNIVIFTNEDNSSITPIPIVISTPSVD